MCGVWGGGWSGGEEGVGILAQWQDMRECFKRGYNSQMVRDRYMVINRLIGSHAWKLGSSLSPIATLDLTWNDFWKVKLIHILKSYTCLSYRS